MDKRSLYDGLNELETELKKSVDALDEMKEAMQKVLEKNTALEIENQHLRELLREPEESETEGDSSDEKEEKLSHSRMNLEKIYEEGFHVCNFYYGSRREDDADCAFCLEVIYRGREK